jgi:hypothetical protein
MNITAEIISMKRLAHPVLLAAAGLLVMAVVARGYPKPSPYPVSWELTFKHSAPKRILITPKGSRTAEAYWYMTYTVTNRTKDSRKFLPVFEMLTDDDKVIRSDGAAVPPVVLDTIRRREKADLKSNDQIAGVLRVGDDQAQDGVAIWREPLVRMGQFSIFVTGLSGESVMVDDFGHTLQLNADGKQVWKDGEDENREPIWKEPVFKNEKKKPAVLWKALQMRYHMPGDDKYPGQDVVELVDEEWVMR